MGRFVSLIRDKNVAFNYLLTLQIMRKMNKILRLIYNWSQRIHQNIKKRSTRKSWSEKIQVGQLHLLDMTPKDLTLQKGRLSLEVLITKSHLAHLLIALWLDQKINLLKLTKNLIAMLILKRETNLTVLQNITLVIDQQGQVWGPVHGMKKLRRIIVRGSYHNLYSRQDIAVILVKKSIIHYTLKTLTASLIKKK
jgi:hypothetical protein